MSQDVVIGGVNYRLPTADSEKLYPDVANAINALNTVKSTSANPVFTGTVTLPSYTLTTLPAATVAGKLIYVSNANAAAGAVAFSNGTNWIDPSTGLPVA